MRRMRRVPANLPRERAQGKRVAGIHGARRGDGCFQMYLRAEVYGPLLADTGVCFEIRVGCEADLF